MKAAEKQREMCREAEQQGAQEGLVLLGWRGCVHPTWGPQGQSDQEPSMSCSLVEGTPIKTCEQCGKEQS